MASPASAMGAGWHGNSHQLPPEPDSSSPQIRSMGLKVHYTFDKDAKINCLARCSHPVQVQTIPLDNFNSIGIVDLRLCIQALSDCSPELASQDCDYTIYAVDYSEPDTPQVGQGLLSWALDSLVRGNIPGHQPKLVTGRVTRNLLGVFAGGNKETLEVKLRLASSAKPQWQPDTFDMAMTPTDAIEWNSFIQSNPELGHPHPHPQHLSQVASPVISQAPGPPLAIDKRTSFGSVSHQQQLNDVQRIAPVPVDTSALTNTNASSRPSSRTSSRAPRKRKPPTGRPRGRPRKKLAEGNTSGYEDGTEGEGEDAPPPAQKRIKTTTVSKAAPNPFALDSESLRVAASTSGSLRNFRPIAINNEDTEDNQIQGIPRAPTPVPMGPVFLSRYANSRRESALGQKPMTYSSSTFAPIRNPLSPEHDRSPESLAPTPTYSEDSPPDIGSSPPVQRSATFLRSSLPPSSPVLPPMPLVKMSRDTSFVSDKMSLLGDELAATAAATTTAATTPQEQQPAPLKPVSRPRKIEPKKSSSVPIQVFQMQDGPQGQDLVHICSYNSTYPSNTQHYHHQQQQQQQQPPHQQPSQLQQTQPELPRLKQEPPPRQQSFPSGGPIRKGCVPSPPGMPPTPPLTTDAAEKPATTPLAEKPPYDVRTETKELKRIAPDLLAQPTNVTDKERPSSQPPVSTAPDTNSKELQAARSQSVGPLVVPDMATEVALASSLSQAVAVPEEKISQLQLPNPQREKATAVTETTTLPASEASGLVSSSTRAAKLSLPEASVPPTEPIQPPPSSPPITRSNKNVVKKHAIKQRLEEAIMNGTMPPFCSNCGAIETPTWRKIWIQDREGTPEYAEYSEKPGRITAIEILQRDGDDKPIQYRVIKKGLGPADDKASWQDSLLCNPCGIWLTKCKTHRPRERWDKDAFRLGQERKRGGTGRSRKSRSKADGAVNPTSEAYLNTDALGAPEPSSPKYGPSGTSNTDTAMEGLAAERQGGPDTGVSMVDARPAPGSTHSAASGAGTAKSPINIELDQAMGSTKRLLFPSPSKGKGVTPRVLGTVDINVVMTDDYCRRDKMVVATEKENMPIVTRDGLLECDNPEALFRSPVLVRPLTPPNDKACVAAGSLETPTRTTPHRPVTRSVSRSLRSVRSVSSPGQLALLQATPSKTLYARVPGSAVRRRSPRNHQGTLDLDLSLDLFDSPISKSITQMLSEPNCFGLDSDADVDNVSGLESGHEALLELGHFLSTDGMMPSSPRKNEFSFDYGPPWSQWNVDTPAQEEEL